jgi:hypothetical protein
VQCIKARDIFSLLTGIGTGLNGFDLDLVMSTLPPSSPWMTDLFIPVLFSLVVVVVSILLLAFVIVFGLLLRFLFFLSFFILLFYLLDLLFHGFFLLLCSLSLSIDDSGGESSITEMRWADIEKVLAEPLE